MALAKPALVSGLTSLFAAPPATYDACAQAWADAVTDWAGNISPPSPAVPGASAALASSLARAFAAPDAIPGMEAAFAAFAVTVGGGMAGFAPTPPAGPVGFATQFAGVKPATSSAAASALASLIDDWMKTGIATLIAPPNTPVPWT